MRIEQRLFSDGFDHFFFGLMAHDSLSFAPLPNYMAQNTLTKFRMSDTLFTAIRSSLDADLTRQFSNLVLYTSYGIVRGRVGRTVTDNLSVAHDARLESVSRLRIETDVLELDDAEVEHFSSHMPTARYNKLYVRIEEIHSFAFDIQSTLG
ncbi:MAG TPA: hypothetical protein PLL06_13365 [Acidobacteriota bacterium]|nr:hypothetical protein [Acidobacteriota bacterium]